MIRRPIFAIAIAALALAACSTEASEVAGKNASASSQPTKSSSAPEEQSPLERNLDASGAAELLKSNAAIIVLDVRTPSEYADGHIADAINVDYRGEAFVEALEKLDRSATYLVHCKSGRRSTAAFAQMLDLEFTSLYHLDGGIDAWTAASGEVVK